MLQTFRRVSDNSVILAIRANLAQGMAHGRDGAIRHAVHVVAGGVLVEVDSATPSPVRGDQPVTLEIPLISSSDLGTLFDIRDGVHGLPVRWENSEQAAVPVLVLDVRSKAFPGSGATLNAHYRATVTVQPT